MIRFHPGQMAFILLGLAMFPRSLPAEGAVGGPPTRHVELTYSCSIQEIPAGAQKIDLWMPVPSDADGQKVLDVKVIRPAGGKIATEAKYGNRIFHKQFTAPFANDPPPGAELSFDVVRNEINIAEAKSLPKTSDAPAPAEMKVYLAPNRLIPQGGKLAELAAPLKLADETPFRAARKVYDYLIDSMVYNWRAPGAGRGDAIWACDSKTGDCTDYNSLFLSLCRSRGIPADHHFGFPVPAAKTSGPIPSYHCWGEFWIQGIGWIPIDASEADKHPELRAYNFGSQSSGMVRMSHGRDVTLEPPQKGEPLNLFIHPYVEIDGKPHEKIKWTVSFRDLPAQ